VFGKLEEAVKGEEGIGSTASWLARGLERGRNETRRRFLRQGVSQVSGGVRLYRLRRLVLVFLSNLS